MAAPTCSVIESMKTLLALLAVAAAASATETERVSFKLPAPGGHTYSIQDFGSRYLLLVYQGVP